MQQKHLSVGMRDESITLYELHIFNSLLTNIQSMLYEKMIYFYLEEVLLKYSSAYFSDLHLAFQKAFSSSENIYEKW